MSIYEDKHRLFRDYFNELNTMRKKPLNVNEEQIREQCDRYITNPYCTWKNIFDPESGDLVGFVLFGKEWPERHPDALRSIAEAYVAPDFRCRGLMAAAVKDYESRHHGVFSLLVLEGNDYARAYWPELFAEMGYTPVTLDPRGVVNHDESLLLGYRPE